MQEAIYPPTVVRDDIVADYTGAIRAVAHLKGRLEERLGVMLDAGACTIPSGILGGSAKATGNVMEAAGLHLTSIVDEPMAAFPVLSIFSGAVVDADGDTTGISVLKDGKVIFTGDKPTGGTHMTLVLVGFHGWNTQKTELAKRDPAQGANVFPAVKPAMGKMVSTARNYLWKYPMEAAYVVGGARCSTQFGPILEKFLDIPAVRPMAPLLVTPLGIAVNCKL